MGQPAQKVLTALPAKGECIRIAALSDKTGIAKRNLVNLVATLTRSGLATAPKIGCYRRTPKGDKFIADGMTVRSGPTKPSAPRPNDNTLRARVWRALRMRKKATVPELLEIADAGDAAYAASNIRNYLRLLASHGIVVMLATREKGAALTSPGFARWSLIRDLGPKAPVARHGGVYDPNRETMVEPTSQVTE